MKDYRFNKIQLEHLKEDCLFANKDEEKEELKHLINNLYIYGFINASQREDFAKLIEE